MTYSRSRQKILRRRSRESNSLNHVRRVSRRSFAQSFKEYTARKIVIRERRVAPLRWMKCNERTE
jgi:hypothetical protein